MKEFSLTFMEGFGLTIRFQILIWPKLSIISIWNVSWKSVRKLTRISWICFIQLYQKKVETGLQKSLSVCIVNLWCMNQSNVNIVSNLSVPHVFQKLNSMLTNVQNVRTIPPGHLFQLRWANFYRRQVFIAGNQIVLGKEKLLPTRTWKLILQSSVPW